MLQEVEKYKTLPFFARQVVEGFLTGLHKSPNHGFSVEFAEHRLYNTGESTRNIDWKLFARSDKLFVKRFEEETNLRCQLVVDHSTSMYFPVENHGVVDRPNKLTFAVYASALLAELFHRQRDAFGLTLFADKVELQTEVRSGSVHQHYIYSLLEQQLQPVQAAELPKRTTSIAPCLHLVAAQLHRRSLVVIFTDAFVRPDQQDELFEALRHLRHCKHEVLLFHTYDYDKELRLDYDGRPYQFIDMESDLRLKVNPAEVAALYRQNMQHLFDEVRQHAMRYRIDYVPVDVGRGFEQVMLPYVLKRGRHY